MRNADVRCRFGVYNPSGKLTTTIYPANYANGEPLAGTPWMDAGVRPRPATNLPASEGEFWFVLVLVGLELEDFSDQAGSVLLRSRSCPFHLFLAPFDTTGAYHAVPPRSAGGGAAHCVVQFLILFRHGKGHVEGSCGRVT
jgi:hypothetical protein